MKGILLCASMLVATIATMAQDIIVTADSKKIEAKILEVSDSQIKYKEVDNIDGPVFVLDTKKINSIIYSNGNVTLYNQTSSDKQQEITSKESSLVTNQEGKIYRTRGGYFRNDVYISATEVARILEREDKAAYKMWNKSGGLAIGGGICIGAGAGLAVGSLFAAYLFNRPTSALIMSCVSIVPTGIGLGLTIGSVVQCNKAINLYNSKYDKAAAQLKWSVAPNGVGLAFAF